MDGHWPPQKGGQVCARPLGTAVKPNYIIAKHRRSQIIATKVPLQMVPKAWWEHPQSWDLRISLTTCHDEALTDFSQWNEELLSCVIFFSMCCTFNMDLLCYVLRYFIMYFRQNRCSVWYLRSTATCVRLSWSGMSVLCNSKWKSAATSKRWNSK